MYRRVTSGPYEPTLEEIAQRCAEIRSTWSPKILQERAVRDAESNEDVPHWTLPEVTLGDTSEPLSGL